MKPRKKRLLFALLAFCGLVIAAVLISQALKSNMAYYYPPAEVVAGVTKDGKPVPIDELIRVGGMVKVGSLQRSADSLDVEFIVSDMHGSEVTVKHTGILPDLFKENQGMVAKGKLDENKVFYAEEVLAKHDESYMPPEVEATLKDAAAKDSDGYGYNTPKAAEPADAATGVQQ